MEEQIVSFDTAKLAKEKGFKTPCSNYYFEDGEFKKHSLTGTNGYYGDPYEIEYEEFLEDWNNNGLTKKNGDRCFGCSKSKGYFETVSAPSQSLLQKWMRELHKIDIIITSEVIGYGILLYERYPPKNIRTKYIFQSYEEALEEGLKQTLNLINN